MGPIAVLTWGLIISRVLLTLIPPDKHRLPEAKGNADCTGQGVRLNFTEQSRGMCSASGSPQCNKAHIAQSCTNYITQPVACQEGFSGLGRDAGPGL